MNTNQTHTYIERNTSSVWARGDGTEIYNGTGTSYTDSGLNTSKLYYYQAWGWNNSDFNWSGTNTSDSNWTLPQIPQSIFANLSGAGTILSFNWTNGTGTDTTLILRKSGSYSLNETDGTVIYNNTWTNHTETSNLTGNYYSLFAYNHTSGLYSERGEAQWGGLVINVYMEHNGTAISNWDCFITNETGTTTFSQTGNNNPTMLDLAILPLGENVAVQISADGYESRVYYQDFNANEQYTLNCYLPIALPPEGTSDPDYDPENESYSYLYLVTVVGPQGEYTSAPLEDARIIFKREVDGTYKNISILFTDANGQVDIYMVPGVIYKVEISKDEYDTVYEDWIPSDSIFTKTFRLYPTEIEGTSYDLFYVGSVHFSAEMIDAGCGIPGNITITFLDDNSSMTDTQIYLFEWYNATETLINTSFNSSNSFSYMVGGINTSRSYKAKLYFNSTSSFDITQPAVITVYAINTYPCPTDKFNLEERIENIVGPTWPTSMGWGNIIAVGLAIAFLVMFGVYNAGMGIIASGLSLGLTEWLYSLHLTNSFNPLLAFLAPIIIFLGIIYIFTKGGGTDKL